MGEWVCKGADIYIWYVPMMAQSSVGLGKMRGKREERADMEDLQWCGRTGFPEAAALLWGLLPVFDFSAMPMKRGLASRSPTTSEARWCRAVLSFAPPHPREPVVTLREADAVTVFAVDVVVTGVIVAIVVMSFVVVMAGV